MSQIKFLIKEVCNLELLIKKNSELSSRIINNFILENSLSEKVGLNVVIKHNKNNKGTITFSYKEMDQLNKIIEIIKSNY